MFFLDIKEKSGRALNFEICLKKQNILRSGSFFLKNVRLVFKVQIVAGKVVIQALALNANRMFV